MNLATLNTNISLDVESRDETEIRNPEQIRIRVYQCRPVALTVEHPAPNRRVGGSNPSRPGVKSLIVIKKILDNIKKIYTEMRKVTWPTRSELINSTIVVIIISAIVAVIIYIFDRFFSTMLHLILK